MWLLPAALGALALALLAGLAYAKLQVDQRDALIAGLNVANSDLANARSALQDDVRRLTGERESLLGSQEALRGQLAETKSQRDSLQTDRDRLQANLDRLEAERDRLRSDRDRLQADRDRLQADRDALGKQLASAVAAPPPGLDDTRKAALARVLDLDGQIEAEFSVFTGILDGVVNNLYRGDMIGAMAGYNRANQSADRLRGLFQARNRAAEPLR